jgi:tRNA dimethylallyltransferase
MIHPTSRRPILIAGPTASGKSALALGLAERLGGWVINADSQQVYADWRVLTARPSAEEEARAPHRLYGHVGAERSYSVGDWTREVKAVLAEADEASATPIIVGGTGLYFRALTQGLAPVPEIANDVRAEAEARAAADPAALFAELAARDPDTAAAIDPQNPMRISRAWEVFQATGRGLADWWREAAPPLLPLERCLALRLICDRDWLYARCDLRFDLMLQGGALAEAERVAALFPPPGAGVLKPVGAAELIAFIRGEISLEDAAAQAKTLTRRYAKRQLTWSRNQMADWAEVDAQENFDFTALKELSSIST